MDEQTTSKKKEVIAALAVLILVVAIVAATTISSKKKDTTASIAVQQNTNTQKTPAQPTNSAPSSIASAAPTSNTTTYKDGDYSATGLYDSPGGREGITVKVTLKDDAVSSTSAISGATDAEAKQYQSQFISNYKDQVVGKKINSIKLSRVAGSSLTSEGFNSAIEQIKKQANQS